VKREVQSRISFSFALFNVGNNRKFETSTPTNQHISQVGTIDRYILIAKRGYFAVRINRYKTETVRNFAHGTETETSALTGYLEIEQQLGARRRPLSIRRCYNLSIIYMNNGGHSSSYTNVYTMSLSVYAAFKR